MKLPPVRLGLLALLLLGAVAPATAQYMYLDSNGDGVHSAADQVNPSGPTVIDVWIDTDSNRDGSPAVCPIASKPMTINHYVVGLRATGGTITWGDFTNRQPSMGFNFGRRENATEFMNGYGGGLILPPGTYHLATLQMAAATGEPSLAIVPSISDPFEMTSFGSQCPGLDMDNSLKLGSDWFDADGLPFGSDGSVNSPPILGQPADMSLLVGETASQILAATDVDHQPLSFSRGSGPAFVTVATSDVGGGTATGKVFVAPISGNTGTAAVSIIASDGSATDEKSFIVTVNAGPNHPPAIEAADRIRAVAGTTARLRLTAIDSDGQPLTFSKVAGPDFASVSNLSSGPGAAAGSLHLVPTLCDAGPTTMDIAVSDGISSGQAHLELLVQAPAPAMPSPPPFILPQYTATVAVGDLNSDGHLDVATTVGVRFTTAITAFLGRGDGTMGPAVTTAVPGADSIFLPNSIAIGDLNRDGHEDLAMTVVGGARVVIFTGRGDGSFDQSGTLFAVSFPQTVKIVDLDLDGALDLAVANGTGSTVSIFLGNGAGSFMPRRDFAAGGSPTDLAVGDFNRDGRLDLAASNFGSKTVGILLGFGDGTFADRREIPFGGTPYPGTPFGIVAADWNWDGKLDLAVSDFGLGKVAIFLGDGDGDFARVGDLGGYVMPQSLAADDLNGDGNLDLLIGDPDNLKAGGPSFDVVYGRGDGTFETPRHIRGGSYRLTAGDLNEDGFADGVLVNQGTELQLWLNDAGGIGAAQARAFPKDGDKALKTRAGGARACIYVEPVAGSYRNTELNLGSITLRSEGTGSVSQISTITPKVAEEKDTDRNGIPELPACFASGDLAKLFDQVQGKQNVTAHLEGALLDGRRFCAKVDLEVKGTPNALAATVSPNPFNPQATLRYSTSGDGFVRVRIFDLGGRLVRTLVDRPLVPAGDHQVVIDGRGQGGEMLASGIYFYQVEALEGTVRGRITILK